MLTLVLSTAAPAHAGTLYITDCSYYGNTAPAFQASSDARDLNTANECMVWSGTAYRSLEINTNGGVAKGYGAEWVTVTPSPAIQIVRVITPFNQVLVDCGLAADGFEAHFYWSTGTQGIVPDPSGPAGSLCYGLGINRWISPSQYFGWSASCSSASRCTASDDSRVVGVRGIYLQAQENTGPTITPVGYGNVWYESTRWVRGTWPMSFSATDPSGVCSTQERAGSQIIYGPGDATPDQSNWQQCPNQELDHAVDTTQFSNGGLTVTLSAENAAGVLASPSERIWIDNAPVKLTMSGPSDAAVTAGTQYISATASAGLSGVGSITCSLDNGPGRVYAASSVRIPVQGLGAHHVACIARNRAIDYQGHVLGSGSESRTITIRQPSVSTVSFAKLADALRCARSSERIRVPGRWIFERIHGHRVRVRVPPQTRTIKVLRCHPRMVKRRVWVGGRWVVERLPVLPRKVSRTTERVRFGESPRVSGWLGTTSGVALAGQRINVMTAPSNGDAALSVAAVATTAANGTWSARLRAGPSRIVQAVYDGSSTVEPASSTGAHLIVPASVRLKIHPRQTHWGGTIAINGRLRGGNVPIGGELVVLWIGWSGGSTEIGHLYARRDGRFASTYTFLRGNGTEAYRLWAASAREEDYPYAPGRSRSVPVTVRP